MLHHHVQVKKKATQTFCSFPVDEGCLQLLCEKDVVGVVVRLMEELPTHYGLQQVLVVCRGHVSLSLEHDQCSSSNQDKYIQLTENLYPKFVNPKINTPC